MTVADRRPWQPVGRPGPGGRPKKRQVSESGSLAARATHLDDSTPPGRPASKLLHCEASESQARTAGHLDRDWRHRASAAPGRPPQLDKALAASTVPAGLLVRSLWSRVTGANLSPAAVTWQGPPDGPDSDQGQLGPTRAGEWADFPDSSPGQQPVTVAGQPESSWAGSLKPVLTHAIFIIDH